MKKKILYVARVCYLDAAIEYLNTIKFDYDVHLVITISPKELNENVFCVSSNNWPSSRFLDFSSVKNSWKLDSFESYFENLGSVKFLLYDDNFYSRNIFFNSFSLIKHSKKLNPDFIHFDDFSPRQMFLIPFLFFNSKKVVMNIHDPLPHLGESIGYINLIKKILFKFLKKYIVFSNYSKDLLKRQVLNKAQIEVLQFLPYSIYNNPNISTNTSTSDFNKFHVTFIGRLSPYKGLELLVETIKLLNSKKSQLSFCIAGKPVYGYDISFMNNIPNLHLIPRFISMHEMKELYNDSSLIICPYIDATQSGVIMTAYGFAKPVIVTNVGGLSEYVYFRRDIFVLNELTPESIMKRLEEFHSNRHSLSNDFKSFLKAQISRIKEQNLKIVKKSIYI